MRIFVDLGWVFTEAAFLDFSFKEIFAVAKAYVTPFKSHSYWADLSATKLRWNFKYECNIYRIRLVFIILKKNIGKITKAEEIDLVTSTTPGALFTNMD